MILKDAPSTASSSGVLEKVKSYFVLAITTQETKDDKNG